MSEFCNVLIVDDELIMRQGMKHMLAWEKEGFQIIGEASNGQEGLALVETLQPHIVLADIVMPVVDGIEFSKIMGKKYPHIQLIMLSSYDKFEYVKTTFLNGVVDYILKPTLNPEILLKTLRTAAAKIPGLTLKSQEDIPCASQMEKVLLGFKEQLDEVIFSECFPHTLFRVMAVNLRTVCGRDQKRILEAREMMEACFAEKPDYVTLPVFLQESILCLVVNYRVKEEAVVTTDTEAIAARLQRIYPGMFLVVSRSFSNMQEIKTYYQQDILSEVNNVFYHPHQYWMIAEAPREKRPVKRFEFEQYNRYLTQGSYGEGLRMFAEYVRYLETMQIEEEKLKNLTKNLLYHFLMEIEKFFIESELLKEQYFETIDSTGWITDYCESMDRIISDIQKLMEQNLGMDDLRIAQIKQYVAKHYSEPLELSDIADRFQFSYNYLSSYFSQTAKEGFSEYLNKIRIGHACDLLRQNQMSIAEIGAMVGYSDHSYFCRVFRKITNETPSGYRRRVKQG